MTVKQISKTKKTEDVQEIKKYKELSKLLAAHIEKNKELNELIERHQKRIVSLEKEKKSLKKLSEDQLLISPVLKEYSIEDLKKMAKIFKVEPYELIETNYTPSAVIKIFNWPTSPHKIVKIAEKHSLFQKSYKVRRLPRLAEKKEKPTTTVFFSILGMIEVRYWYKWEKDMDERFNRIWKRHKKVFTYLAKN